MSFIERLGALAASDGERIALRIDGGAALTYAEWGRRSTAWAEALVAAGVSAGERVALLFPPHGWTEYAVAYAAVRKIGAVAVPIGAADLGAVEIGRILRAAEVTTVVAPEPASGSWSVRTLRTGDLDAVPFAQEAAQRTPVMVMSTNATLNSTDVAPTAPLEILAVARQLAIPRLIVRSAADVAASRWPVSGCATLIHAFPVGTAAGQDALLAALAGAPLTITMLAELDVARFDELVADGADACALHHAAAQALVETGAAARPGWSSLKVLVLAGDDARDELIGRLRDAFPTTTIAVVATPPASTVAWHEGWTTAPVAVSQEGMLWHECLAPGCQNLPGLARRFRGPLGVAALGRALDELRRRHEAIRTQFEIRDRQLIQVVRPYEPLVLRTVDVSSIPAESQQMHVANTVADAGQRPFDLVSEPLFQPSLMRLADDDHVLVIRAHHTVFDDWSVGVFRRELAALYSAFAAGTDSPLPEPPLQFAEFATRQRERLSGPQGQRDMAFWRRELDGAPFVTQLPVADPDLPPGSPQASGEPVTLDVPAGMRDAVRALAQRERVTVYMAMLAAFGLLTSLITDQDDLLLASVVANRNRAELEGLIGCFTKKVPVRLRLDGDPTFLEVLAQTRQALLGAIAHQDPAFDAVLHEVLGPAAARHGLVPHAAVMFQGVTPGHDLVLPGVESEGLGTSMTAVRAHFASARKETTTAAVAEPPWGSGLQLGTFVIVTLIDEDERLSLVARGAFHGPAMRDLLNRFDELLAQLVATPDCPVSEIAARIAGCGSDRDMNSEAIDLRGYRVDPARVEAALADCPGVRSVSVEVRRDAAGETELAAHVVADGTPPTLADLRAWEWSRLPGYAWPATVSVTPPRAGRARSDPNARVLRSVYASALGYREIAPDMRYWQDSAVLDALGRAREAGIAVPHALVAPNRTVEMLAGALTARRCRRETAPPGGAHHRGGLSRDRGATRDQ